MTNHHIRGRTPRANDLFVTKHFVVAVASGGRGVLAGVRWRIV